MGNEVSASILSSDSSHVRASKRPKYVAKIPTDDLDALYYYFEHGIRRLEWPSTMGAQIERLSFFAARMVPCTHCGGRRRRMRDGVVVREERAGTGFVAGSKDFEQRELLIRLGVLKKSQRLQGTDPCPKCSVPKKDKQPEGKWEARFAGTQLFAPGWVPGGSHSKRKLSARPTGSSKSGSGVPDTGGDDNLALISRVIRVLGAVHAIDAVAALTLATFSDPSGRTVACLWHLTPAGKTMLRKKNNKDLHQRQFFENERKRQEDNPTPNRARQFRAADDQSHDLWERAQLAWVLALAVLAGDETIESARRELA